jgi:hypothetical protein
MKIEIKFVKNALKYVTIALGIMIMIIQFYFISFEFNKKNLSNVPVDLKETSKPEYCEDSSLNKITDLAIKSVMAFVGGCLFSEKKFIRFGVI